MNLIEDAQGQEDLVHFISSASDEVNVRSMLLLACIIKSVRLKLLSYFSRRMIKLTPRLMGARSIMRRP